MNSLFLSRDRSRLLLIILSVFTLITFNVLASPSVCAEKTSEPSVTSASVSVEAKLPQAVPLQVPADVLAHEQLRVDSVSKVYNASVSIFPPKGGGGGSGVIISPDGYAVTNCHVVMPCGIWMRCGLSNGVVYDAVLVGMDPVGDVALIKLFPNKTRTLDGKRVDATVKKADEDKSFSFPYVELGNSDNLIQGDPVFILGNPFTVATDLRPTLTSGIISGIRRYQFPAGTLLEYTDCIQVDASINPGNSGGPLFNIKGQLIGINGRGSFEKRGRVNVGVGYAISVNQVKNFLGPLRSGRILDHATLGATVMNDSSGNIFINNILEDSDAHMKGIIEGDTIISFAGRRVFTANDFKNILGTLPKHWSVPVTYERNTGKGEIKRYNTHVMLSGVHSDAELLDILAKSGLGDIPGKDQERPKKENKKNAEDKNLPEKKKSILPEGLPDEIEELLGKMKEDKIYPAIVNKHYEARSGWANYYFSRSNRDRAWENLIRASVSPAPENLKQGRFSSPDKSWSFTGTLLSGSRFELHLEPSRCSMKFPTNDITWDITENFTTPPTPPETGILLPGFALWKRLLTEGPEKFGGLTYWGTAPLPYENSTQITDRLTDAFGQPLYDVFYATYGGLEVRFYLDTCAKDMFTTANTEITQNTQTGARGELVLMLIYTPDSDYPWQYRFSNFQEKDGLKLPHKIELIRATEQIGLFNVESVLIN